MRKTAQQEDSLRVRYRDHLADLLHYRGRLAAVLALVIIPAFAAVDISSFGVDVAIIAVFRGMPVFFALIFLVLSFTPTGKSLMPLEIVYRLLMLSMLVMMYGIYLLVPRYHVRGDNALLLVIFLCYAANFFGYRALACIYAVTALGGLVAAVHLGMEIHSSLSNILAAILLFPVLAFVQERLRYSAFRSGVVIETQNRELKEKTDRIEAELTLAREVQRCIIPAALPEIEGVSLASLYVPLEEVGGDFYDAVFPGGRDSVGLFIGDVSGHGLPAALVTSMIKMLINTAGDLLSHPARLLEQINRNITGQTGGNFLTAFYCLYDAPTRTLRYARAGHPFPFLVRGGDSVTEIRSAGTFLGIHRNVRIEEKEIQLERGDRVLLYTDGLTEAENDRGETFEVRALSRALALCGGMPIGEFVPALYKACEVFKGRPGFEDDICIIGMEILC